MNLNNIIFTGILLFIAGLLFFSLAFHSIDLGYNCHTFQTTTIDIILDKHMTCSDMYVTGIRTLYISMIFFCLSFFILIYPLYAFAVDRHLKIGS